MLNGDVIALYDDTPVGTRATVVRQSIAALAVPGGQPTAHGQRKPER